MKKSLIRNKILKEKKSGDSDSFNKKNYIISQELSGLLKVIYKKGSIGLYCPMPFEPKLLDGFSGENYELALPHIIDEKHMAFGEYKINDPLKESRFKDLYEPKNFKEIIPSIIVLSGLNFDLKGGRIGFGYGYYDRYFGNIKENPPIKIGVCFHDFICEDLPKEKFDLKVDYLITDKIFIKL